MGPRAAGGNGGGALTSKEGKGKLRGAGRLLPAGAIDVAGQGSSKLRGFLEKVYFFCKNGWYGFF